MLNHIVKLEFDKKLIKLKKMKKRTAIIYGNCRIYSPTGVLLSLCTEKRINWYLSRNLAEIINESPLEIRLNFTPKCEVRVFSEYYLAEKRNACVCCNNTNLMELTKHHIVPIEYRKHMPESIKSRSSHDIVPLCEKCHSEYEDKYASKLKLQLEDECSIERTKISEDRLRTFKAYRYVVLLSDEKKSEKIPNNRIHFMYKEIKDVFGHINFDEILPLKLYKLLDKQDYEIGKEVLDLQLNHEDFIKMWRKHFIDSMKPQYMPISWSIDAPIYHINYV